MMAEPGYPIPAPSQRRIPEFATREEETVFWDTHDISDYWDELQPIAVSFASNLSDDHPAKARREVPRGA